MNLCIGNKHNITYMIDDTIIFFSHNMSNESIYEYFQYIHNSPKYRYVYATPFMPKAYDHPTITDYQSYDRHFHKLYIHISLTDSYKKAISLYKFNWTLSNYDQAYLDCYSNPNVMNVFAELNSDIPSEYTLANYNDAPSITKKQLYILKKYFAIDFDICKFNIGKKIEFDDHLFPMPIITTPSLSLIKEIYTTINLVEY